MNVQELMDSINKAQNDPDLNPVAVWAISVYLNGVWKDEPERSIRPYNLGQAMSDFFVDLSQHRLPEKIIRQTPETESILMDFFGASIGSLSQFWTECLHIWDEALKSDAVFASEVKEYFDMLLSSSLRGPDLQSPSASVAKNVVPPDSGESNPKLSIETPSPYATAHSEDPELISTSPPAPAGSLPGCAYKCANLLAGPRNQNISQKRISGSAGDPGYSAQPALYQNRAPIG